MKSTQRKVSVPFSELEIDHVFGSSKAAVISDALVKFSQQGGTDEDIAAIAHAHCQTLTDSIEKRTGLHYSSPVHHRVECVTAPPSSVQNVKSHYSQ